jgi:transcription elongation factor Elf1
MFCLGTGLGTSLGTSPGTGLGTSPGTGLGTSPGTGLGTSPGTGLGTSPGTGLGTSPGKGTGLGTSPGKGPGPGKDQLYYSYISNDNSLGYINCFNCKLALEQAIKKWHERTIYIEPRRLVYIRIENNCMFCVNPTGPVYGRYVDIEANYGYIHCGKCIVVAEHMVNTWNKKVAYGRVKYLKHSIINIKRSSGAIEPGWRIHGPMIVYDNNNKELIHCTNETNTVFRWCLVDDLLELNPGFR